MNITYYFLDDKKTAISTFNPADLDRIFIECISFNTDSDAKKNNYSAELRLQRSSQLANVGAIY